MLMSISGKGSIKWQQFSPDDVTKIIKLILDSNKSFKVPPKKTSSKLEDHITNRFCAHLRNHKNRSIHFFRIEPQSDILNDTGELVGRIDLKFISGNEEKVYFSFECKVLRVTRPSGQISASYSEYVKEGMYRYFNGQYARDLDKGGMLGYVMDGDCAKAAKGVQKAIEKGRLDLYMQENETLKASSCVALKQVKETHHQYGPNKKFTIYHIFLPMNATPNNN
jgi:hypothetical protein